jgi:hypothetical protein
MDGCGDYGADRWTACLVGSSVENAPQQVRAYWGTILNQGRSSICAYRLFRIARLARFCRLELNAKRRGISPFDDAFARRTAVAKHQCNAEGIPRTLSTWSLAPLSEALRMVQANEAQPLLKTIVPPFRVLRRLVLRRSSVISVSS